MNVLDQGFRCFAMPSQKLCAALLWFTTLHIERMKGSMSRRGILLVPTAEFETAALKPVDAMFLTTCSLKAAFTAPFKTSRHKHPEEKP